MTEVVGFVGLGAMGYPMARHLARSLHSTSRQLRVFNRTVSKVDELAADAGASPVQAVSSLTELAEACDVVFMMLSHDTAVQDVVKQLLAVPAAKRKLSVLVDCSTVLPTTTQAMAASATEGGVAYGAACVFGRPDAVVAGRLILVAAGPDEARSRAVSYLSVMCVKTIQLGNSPHMANVMKLCGNFSIVSMIEMIAETLTLGEKNGLSREVVVDFLSTFYPSPAVQGYASRIAADSFEAGQGFSVELGLKDVGHMRKLAEQSSVPLPMADIVFQHLLQARANGHGASDWGALALSVRQSAGMAIPAPPSNTVEEVDKTSGSS